jgi:hypothetical protein
VGLGSFYLSRGVGNTLAEVTFYPEFIRCRSGESYSRGKSNTKAKRSGSPLRVGIDNVNADDLYFDMLAP